MISLLSITNPDLARSFVANNGIVSSSVSRCPVSRVTRWRVWEDKAGGVSGWHVATFARKSDAVKMSKAINEKIASLTR
jgi:hypothetical protein